MRLETPVEPNMPNAPAMCIDPVAASGGSRRVRFKAARREPSGICPQFGTEQRSTESSRDGVESPAEARPTSGPCLNSVFPGLLAEVPRRSDAGRGPGTDKRIARDQFPYNA